MSKIILVYSEYPISKKTKDELKSAHPMHKVFDSLDSLSVVEKVEFVKKSNDLHQKILFVQGGFFLTLYRVAIKDKLIPPLEVSVFFIDKEGHVSNFQYDKMGNFEKPKNFRDLTSAYESRLIGYPWKDIKNWGDESELEKFTP